MKTYQLPGEVIWILEEGFFGYLGTSSKNKDPHVTPMIFVYDGEHIFFLTSKESKKIRNLVENPQVAFLIDLRDPSNLLNNRAILVHGKAKPYGIIDALLHLKSLLRIRRLFINKYPRYMEFYSAERDRIPKRWRTTLFQHRILFRLSIEKFVYMREAHQVSLERRHR